MIVHPNRWLIWTIVLVVVIGLLTAAYIEYAKGEVDRETAQLLWNPVRNLKF